MKAIDGTTPETTDLQKYYSLPAITGELDASFLYSDSLEEVEGGTAALAKTGEILSLVQGIAIIRIERDGLWRQAGYDTLRAYRIAQGQRLGMARATISNRRKIAEAWLTYRKHLSRLSLEGRISKLMFLQDAFETHDSPREIIEHFKNDTYDAFASWARGVQARPELPPAEAFVDADGIKVDGEYCVLWSGDLPDTEKVWLGGLLDRAYKARAGGNLAHVVSVYDEGEARAVDNFLKKLRSSK